MLNRRILREKAFKVLYSYAENPGMSLKELEANLEISCEATRDLYLFLLSIINPLTEYAAQKINAAMQKFNPSKEELHPNLKFVNNRIAPFFNDDPDFVKISSKKKRFSFELHDAFIAELYNKIKNSSYFQKYLLSDESSLREDALLFKTIFEREFIDNAKLEEILEDMSIYWNDDLGIALNACAKDMNAIAKSQRWNLPYLYQSDRIAADIRSGKRQDIGKELQSDREFVVKIVRGVYAKYNDYCQAISALTPQWTLDRLCTTDLVLISCGLAEAKAFPSTPFNIIINEYVELTKYYSTPESKSFVNGLLDKLLKQLQ